MTDRRDEGGDSSTSSRVSRRSYMGLSALVAAPVLTTAARGRGTESPGSDDENETSSCSERVGDSIGYGEAGYGEYGYGGVVSSEPDTLIVEDGEGDLSAYTGNESYYGTTNDAISGTGSIVAVDAEHGGYRTVVSGSGLSNYPEAGDTFQFDVAVDTRNTYGGVLWGVQSSGSPWPCYRLRLDTGASPGIDFEKITTELESHNNPDRNKLAPWLHDNEDVRPEVGTEYTVTVDWGTDGVMAFLIEEKATGNVLVEETDPKADTEYTGGGVGFMSSRSWDGQDQAEARFDNYELL